MARGFQVAIQAEVCIDFKTLLNDYMEDGWEELDLKFEMGERKIKGNWYGRWGDLDELMVVLAKNVDVPSAEVVDSNITEFDNGEMLVLLRVGEGVEFTETIEQWSKLFTAMLIETLSPAYEETMDEKLTAASSW